jgi:hypothetical protein
LVIRELSVDDVLVVRAFSCLSLGGAFLMISPGLRGSVYSILNGASKEMELWSPYSYIAAAFLLLMTLVISMYRGAQPR